jgi:hypothetical protein
MLLIADYVMSIMQVLSILLHCSRYIAISDAYRAALLLLVAAVLSVQEQSSTNCFCDRARNSLSLASLQCVYEC